MVRPQAYKSKCSQCHYQKIVHPKSDVLNSNSLLISCPKCKGQMHNLDLSKFEKVLYGTFLRMT